MSFKLKVIIIFGFIYFYSCHRCKNEKQSEIVGINSVFLKKLPNQQIVPNNYKFKRNEDTMILNLGFEYKLIASFFEINQLFACKPVFIKRQCKFIEIKSIYDYKDTLKKGESLNNLFFVKSYYFDSISKNKVMIYDKLNIDNINKIGLDGGISLYLKDFPKKDSDKFNIKLKIDDRDMETTTETIYFQ